MVKPALTTTRRRFCTSIAAAGLFTRSALASQPLTVTDMAGRTVKLAVPPRRIVLLEARDLFTMSLLHPDPASLVVGWAAVDRIDSESLQKRLVNGHDIAAVGKQSPDTVSLEGLVALAPDLVVTSAFMTPEADPLIGKLEQFGIPVVFSDASSNAQNEGQAADPAGEIRASMALWGTLLGAKEKADAFVWFFDGELAAIRERLAGAKPVTTYLEVQSTADDCCWAAGRKVWGTLLELAGGTLLPGVTAPWFQKLSVEYLITEPHDVYIASGGGWATGIRPAIGPGLGPERGREGLQRLIDGRHGFGELASVRNKRVYGIWTGLMTNLPLNILFVAQAARWLHPERFADFDPVTILDRINRDFAAFPVEGPLWVSIQDGEN